MFSVGPLKGFSRGAMMRWRQPVEILT